MYICLECGHIFDEGEEVEWTEPHGEKMVGCPMCNGAFARSAYCEECGKEILPDELRGGHYCDECLADSVDFTTGLNYLSYYDYMVQFVMERLLKSSVPEVVSPELRKAAIERFMRTDRDCRLRNDDSFLTALKDFILDGDGEYGKEQYAKWLDLYRRGKGATK